MYQLTYCAAVAVAALLDLAAAGAVGGDRGGDQVVAEGGAQRLHQPREGLRAAGVAGQAAGVGVLPVDVDAVEHVGPARVLDQRAARLGERRRVLRGLGEAAGPGPAAEGPDDLQVGVLRLELAELVEVAAQALVPRVGDTVDALRRGVGLLVVGVGVTDGAAAVLDVAEGVEDVGQLGGGAVGVEVLGVEVAGVRRPVGEVADDLLAARVGRGGGRRRGRRGVVVGRRGRWAAVVGPPSQAPRSTQTPHSPVVPGTSPWVHHFAR